MAKKFGKFLLATAAIGSAVAAYCYFKKKDADLCTENGDDEDFDDLDDSADSSRNYVPLNCEAAVAEEDASEDSFTPLAEQVSQAEETVEDFFDEEESSEN